MGGVVTMKKSIKTFTFWFTILSIIICTVNILGFDDKNFLLFFTSIPLMLTENYSPYIKRFFASFISYSSVIIIFKLSLYIIHFSGSIVAGFLIDLFGKFYLRKK